MTPSAIQDWKGTEELLEGQTILLEASAGTGKTYQIAGLVTRLVAEYRIPIGRILVITFTNAATAELRHRVRARLSKAREAMLSTARPDEDPIFARLWEDESLRDERRGLLEAALSAFDQAPISTIHGFCQRMLEQLAFESGQEPGLELVDSVALVIEELIADAMAYVYANASEPELALLEDAQWEKKKLKKLAEQMIRAVEPGVEPRIPVKLGSIGEAVLTSIRPCEDDARNFKQWLEGDAGQAAIAAVKEEVAKAKRKAYVTGLKGKVEKLAKLEEWASSIPKKGPKMVDLTLPRLEKGWRGPGSFQDFAAYPIFEWVTRLGPLTGDALQEAHREFGAWWQSEAAAIARDALRHEANLPLSKLANPKEISGDLDGLKSWLATDAVALPGVKHLSLPKLEKYWRGDGEVTGFTGYPLFERCSAIQVVYAQRLSEVRAQFALKIRALVEGELLRKRQLSFSSLISRLAARIQATGGGESALAKAIRGRFDVALIDEFQDTDGAQWPIMSAVFQHPRRRLLLVGDPKQAIYSFRGADVHVYTEAARTAGKRATMKVNWRSDGRYVEAMNRLFQPGTSSLGLEGVDYIEVEACEKHRATRMRTAPEVGSRERRPLELRWVDAVALGQKSAAITNKPEAQRLVATLAAQEAARLLRAGTELATDQDGESEWRALEPKDIAVLVRTNAQAESIRRALGDYGIPAVTGGRGSVFASDAAQWVLMWLEAVGNAGSTGHARRLVVTPMFGWTANRLASALAESEAAVGAASHSTHALGAWDHWLQSVRGWTQRWSKHGFIGAFDATLDSYGVLKQLLSSSLGERAATDLRHIAELCHSEERRTRTGPLGLAEWLRQQINRATDQDEVSALRLESDARAVQIVTIHKSKGLEWPVVLLPFPWADFRKVGGPNAPITWHETQGEEQRLWLNVELDDSPTRGGALAAAEAESQQENRRLLYVALTRAAHHCVAWMGPLGSENKSSHEYALGAVLFRDSEGRPLAGEPWEMMQARAEESDGTIGAWVESEPGDAEPVKLDEDDPVAVSARAWDSERSLQSAWQVASYSSMVRGRTLDAAEPQRPELEWVRREPAVVVDGADVELSEPSLASDLGELIGSHGLFGGTEVGTWAHAVYEHLDFAEGRALDGAPLAELIKTLGAKYGISSDEQVTLLQQVVLQSLHTGLDGPNTNLSDGFTLGKIVTEDRVDEMAFDLKVGAGNRWTRAADLDTRLDAEAAAKALQQRAGDLGWGGDAWLQSVLQRSKERETGVLPRIAGMLTGFIDLTFRVGERYYVADYKTNRIAPVGQKRDSRVGHYDQAWMAWEMAHHGYHLQSLLYTVALHRLLQSRLGDEAYDYDKHVGGHFYLFLRGMTGEHTPRDKGMSRGVYFDRWPKSVVEGIDAALSGEAS